MGDQTAAISTDQVAHVARLARIELTSAEIDHYTGHWARPGPCATGRSRLARAAARAPHRAKRPPQRRGRCASAGARCQPAPAASDDSSSASCARAASLSRDDRSPSPEPQPDETATAIARTCARPRTEAAGRAGGVLGRIELHEQRHSRFQPVTASRPCSGPPLYAAVSQAVIRVPGGVPIASRNNMCNRGVPPRALSHARDVVRPYAPRVQADGAGACIGQDQPHEFRWQLH